MGLVDHARQELIRIGEDPVTISGYLDVIQAFADMGHSGGSASVAIPVIERLLKYKPLSPLTDNPDEWLEVSTGNGQNSGLWQSTRDPECFSTDGGKTYYCLSERDVDPSSLHESVKTPTEGVPINNG
jgi:hypothetical protein